MKTEKKFNPNDYLIDLKGKKYLQVMHRILWFRNEHPDWSIETMIEARGEGWCICRATVKDETGRIISQGVGSETKADFNDYIEKCETKAIGRALALAGFGTQFSVELEEGERIVDSPVMPASQRSYVHIDPMTAPQKTLIINIAKNKGMSSEELSRVAKALTGKEFNEFTKVDAMTFIKNNSLESPLGTIAMEQAS